MTKQNISIGIEAHDGRWSRRTSRHSILIVDAQLSKSNTFSRFMA
jgi:hypothetical protein